MLKQNSRVQYAVLLPSSERRFTVEIRNLNTFVSICELGSFTKAAKALGYSQSTVSFQIKQLENELNCSLFDRINHTISLTERGRELLALAQQITKLTYEFNQNINAERPPDGRLHIVTPDSVCQDMMCANYIDFHSRYPDISLRFTTADTVEMFGMLERNEADLMLTLDNRRYKNGYVIVKEERVATHFVTGAGSPYATDLPLTLKDISDKPFLLTERGVSYRRAFDEELAKRAAEINPVLELGRTDVIVEMLSRGVGISYLPDFVTKEGVAEGRLKLLNVTDVNIEIWKQLIHHKNKWISRSLRALMDYIMEHEFHGA